jgi:hypothetical protein
MLMSFFVFLLMFFLGFRLLFGKFLRSRQHSGRLRLEPSPSAAFGSIRRLRWDHGRDDANETAKLRVVPEAYRGLSVRGILRRSGPPGGWCRRQPQKRF